MGTRRTMLRLLSTTVIALAMAIVVGCGPAPTPVTGLRVEYQVQCVDGRCPTAEDLAVVREIVERRVVAVGVVGPVVRAVGQDRLVLELPGVQEGFEVRALAGQTGLLDIVAIPEGTFPQNGDVIDLGPGSAYRVLVSGDQIADAAPGVDSAGRIAIDLTLRREGAVLFADFTRANVGRQIAILVDGVVISAPIVQAAIVDGRLQVTGGSDGFGQAQVSELVTMLRFGALPFPLVELEHGPLQGS